MKYARIVNNFVYETFTPHSGATIEESMTPELVAQFIPCPDEVEQNWAYLDGIFIEPPKSVIEDTVEAEEVITAPAIESPVQEIE